jgi:cysteine desulfurase
MKNDLIYLDHAATTYVKDEVLTEMKSYFTESFGNPSSIYKAGRENKKVIENAREKVAKAINADKYEIYFTGSGSESDNWAIKGILGANIKKGNHIITTKIEHHAVLDTCKFMEKHGFEVTYLDVDSEGIISIDDLKAAIKDNTVLISVMFANNEIGTIQPIKEIGTIAKENNILFHTDAVQAIGNIDIDVKELNIDLLSMSAHKFYGPKGVGALYIKKGTRISQLIHGGGQESKRRAGTENVAGIVGMGKAIELATQNIEEYNKKLIFLRDRTIKLIEENIPSVRLNGHRTKRLPGNVNFSFEFIEGESLLLLLDSKKIAGSSGSACTSGSLDPSHVLLAIGLKHEIAHGSLRLTFGECNNEEDVDYLVEELQVIVNKLRMMSPLYNRKEMKQ